MKRIDRHNMIDSIGRELQERMTFTDIKVFLSGFNIDLGEATTSVNSKWVYVKELLAGVSDEVIIEIADELEIEHSLSVARNIDMRGSKFWQPSYFRLFISHLASCKETATRLQKALCSFGISAFVAHEDIEPTKEWQEEIEKALFSMDALVAILTPGFRESNWTDQEVGVAIGRDVLVVSIRKGLDPYGFIAKNQGIQGGNKKVVEVAESVFEALTTHPKTKGRMADSLVEQILSSRDIGAADIKLRLLFKIEKLPMQCLEKLQENTLENQKLAESESFVLSVNEFLERYDMPPVIRKDLPEELHVDDILF